MDCQMPVVDGYQATRQIREAETAGRHSRPLGRVPIIALTANSSKATGKPVWMRGLTIM